MRDSREQLRRKNEGKLALASLSLFPCEMGEQKGRLRGRVERGGNHQKRNTEGWEYTFG